ncbi:MAG: hypothetical protein RR854_00345 [Muribaculaceae bacterium]
MITISICLSDIPQESRHKADNGKIYANFCIDKRREPDKFGNTHTVWMQQTKEQRQAKLEKKYIGSGKEYVFQNQEPQQETNEDLPY